MPPLPARLSQRLVQAPDVTHRQHRHRQPKDQSCSKRKFRIDHQRTWRQNIARHDPSQQYQSQHVAKDQRYSRRLQQHHCREWSIFHNDLQGGKPHYLDKYIHHPISGLPYAPPPPTGNDTILYTNTPSPLSYSTLVFYPSGGLYSNVAITSNSLQATYAGQPGRYTFLCFPKLGLYRLYPTKTVHDTVDCSVMETDISGNYNTSSYFTFSDQSIYGFPDSTDLTSGLQLYYNDSPSLPQFLYPPKVLQKYTASTYFIGSNNDQCRSYTYGNTIPSTVTYPVPPSITSTQNNNFSLNLNTAKPTYYYTVWESPTINWTLYSSPDSTTLNPVNLLTTQKSKLLQGTSLSSLTLTEFKYETIQGYNYLNFLNLVCNSVKPAYTEITSAIFYDKAY